jgi:hypothetical protein
MRDTSGDGLSEGCIKQGRYIEAGQHPSDALGGWKNIQSLLNFLLQNIMSQKKFIFVICHSIIYSGFRFITFSSSIFCFGADE